MDADITGTNSSTGPIDSTTQDVLTRQLVNEGLDQLSGSIVANYVR